MAESCFFGTIDTNKFSALKALESYCGSNATAFATYSWFVIDRQEDDKLIPTDDFKQWYEDNYKSELNFNSGEGIRMRDAIIKYYNEKNFNVKDTAKTDATNNKVVRFGYTTSNARVTAKRIIVHTVLNLYNINRNDNSVMALDRYREEQLEKASFIAEELIEKSELTEEEKNQVLDEIYTEDVTTAEQVRHILNKWDLNDRFNIESRNKTYYFNKAKYAIREQIADRIIKRKGYNSEEEYNVLFEQINETLLNDGWLEYAKKELGGKNISMNDTNLLATYSEFYNAGKEFVDEICLNKDLGKLRLDDEFVDKEENTKKIESAEEADDSNEESDGEETNTTTNEDNIGVGIYDHSGLYQTALTHIDEDVKVYLGSLYKLNSNQRINGRYDYDLNNELGLPDYMNVNECATVLYHYCDFTNYDTMLKSIEHIADTMPGFAGFYKLLDDLRNNSDLAFKIYNTFGKLVISKVQVELKNGKPVLRISNRRNNKLDALRMEFLNTVRYNSINNEVQYNEKQLEELAKDIDTYKKLKSDKLLANIISKLSNIVKQYYSTVDPLSIENYINKNKVNDKLDKYSNIIKLYNIIKDTVAHTRITQNNYNDFVTKQNEIRHHNKKLKNVIGQIDYTLNMFENIISVDKIKDNLKKKGYKYIEETLGKDEAKRYKLDDDNYNEILITEAFTEYISAEQTKDALRLATELVDYSLVSIELNSTNVKFNQSSDVINSSYITNMITLLKDKVALQKYGELKAIAKQYNFSNILFERTIEETNETIPGLFRKNTDGSIELTNYADRLLSIHLFDGAKNADNENAALYKEMSKGDYIGTAFIGYFHPDQLNTDLDTGKDTLPFKTATYFMRIPSDAPKNFYVRGVRYDTSNLFKIINQSEIEEAQRAKIASIFERDDTNKIIDDKVKLAVDKTIVVRNISQFIRHITTADGYTTKLPNWVLEQIKKKEGEEITLKYQYLEEDEKLSDENNTNIYTLTGTVKNGKLVNCHFNGIYKYDISQRVREVIYGQVVKDLDKKGLIQRTLNPKHIVIQQLRNIAKQEILDAAVAIDKFFVTWDNGLIRRYDDNYEDKSLRGQIMWKEGVSHNGKEVSGAYDNYHHKKGKIIDVDDNGNEILTGNVFHSSKFIVTKDVIDENGNQTTESINYGEQLWKEAFNLLYGGANANFIQIVKDPNTGEVLDVNIDAISSKIDNMISDFVSDLLSDANQRLEQFESIIPSEELTYDNAADFILNYYIAYNNFDDVFEGNSKFYKDTQTFLKRAKEVQGSGTPYGVSDFRTQYDGQKNLLENSRLNALFPHIKMYDKFTAITIKNTIKTGPTIGEFKRNKSGKPIRNKEGHYEFEKIGNLANKLIKRFESEGYKHDDAVNKTADMLVLYADTTVNDAQSYITFDEWVRRITARGQLGKYQGLIQKVYNEEPLTIDDISEFIQVQKNFFYDLYYDKDSNLFVPRQIKNAEFVLVPQLIEGTELEQVYDLMQREDIDQLNTEETSKAGKTNVLELFDPKTGKLREDVNKDLLNRTKTSSFYTQLNKAKQLFSYSNLYTQQETPQHMYAENKAAIQIMKKILDNIPEFNKDGSENKLYKVKQTFFKLYCANIKDSYETFMKELACELDANGNIVVERQEDGSLKVKGINHKLFYDRLKEEVTRLNLDSNVMDYVTLDNSNLTSEGTITIMPNFMSMVSQKLENISQSLFNSRITRQKLPGFHAAQVSNVGLTPYAESAEKVGYSSDLRYYPEVDGETQSYVEIKLPASAFGFRRYNDDGSLKSDNQLLKELQAEGLDEIIGYRIPTEGKQSIAIMKVVGFISDGCGSTIIVPDDWVSQTGSDFDIDSVYGIQHVTRVNKKNGKIEKIKYNEGTSERDYFDYLRHRIKKMPNTSISKKVEALKKQLDEQREDYKLEGNNLQEIENQAYNKLSETTKKYIKENYTKLEKKSKENYLQNLQNLIQTLNSYLNTNGLPRKEKSKINDLIVANQAIIDHINSKPDYKELFDTNIEQYKAERLDDVEVKAHSAGLPSYEEFKQLSEEDRNTRDQRTNGIVDCFLSILKDDDTLEEKLSTSNFKAIIDARDKIYEMGNMKFYALRRDNRTAYNFLDQADYQEDAMGGAKLKAFSVTRDTFCSICNTVRPTIGKNHAISIFYSKGEITEAQAIARFGKDNVIKVHNGIIIRHDKLGWSLDNKNIVDKLITCYSSQTTAHILDAIKEGSIPNVNDLTFAVYKLFPDLGIDYETGIGFILQNGIARICKEYNATKSVYEDSKGKPINKAIRTLSTELGFDPSEFNSIDELLAAISQQYGEEYKKIFGDSAEITTDASKLSLVPINKQQLLDNLSSPLEGIDAKLFDLGIILQYKRLNELGETIGKLTRICNPDKFGAKQSIYETNKVFDDISELTSQYYTNIFNVNGNSFIDAIYPGLVKHEEDGNYVSIEDFVKSPILQSKYPSLYYFLKYSTAPSTIINKELFDTQKDSFINNVKHLELYLNGRPLTTKEYKDFEKFIIGHLYNNVESLTLPIGFDIKTNNFVFAVDDKLDENQDEKNKTIAKEKTRIFGYNRPPKPIVKNEDGKYVDFVISNINHPTNEDIAAFIQLTPAQKVAYIQQHSIDPGVFKYVQTNIYNSIKNGGKKVGSQTITFVDTVQNIEDVYIEFEEAFNNNNPLIAIAAYDLIKYAFIVEGYNFKKRAISKMIPNSVLYNSFDSNGTSVVQLLRDKMNNIHYMTQELGINEICEQYVRANAKKLRIPYHVVKKQGQVDDLLRINGIAEIYLGNEQGINIASQYDLVKLIETDTGTIPQPNQFVRLKYAKEEETLYKIYHVPERNSIYLYPVNNLEENEHSDFSSNPKNNIYYSDKFYTKIIDEYKKRYADYDTIRFRELYSELTRGDVNTDDYAAPEYESFDTLDTIDFNLDNPPADLIGTVDMLKKKVQQYFADGNINRQFTLSNGLPKYIKRPGEEYGLTKSFVLNSNTKEQQLLKVRIYKLDFSDKLNSIQPYLKNTSLEISPEHKEYTNIISELRNDGIKDITNESIYVLDPQTSSNDRLPNAGIKEGKKKAKSRITTTTIGQDIRNLIGNKAKSDSADLYAKHMNDRWNDKGISNDKVSIESNIVDVLKNGADYINKQTERIMNDLRYFVHDPDGEGYISITDPKVAKLVRTDTALRDKYLQTILDAEALVDRCKHIFKLDIDSQDEKCKRYLTVIKRCINDLHNTPFIEEANTIFAEDVLGKLSDNPLIQRDVINVLDGYYSTNAVTAWIGDLQENPNPFVQILTKYVTSDITAKDWKTKEFANNFLKRIEEFKREASRKGESFDLNHIIDDSGRIIQKFDNKLLDDMYNLRNEVINAKQDFLNATNDLQSYHAYKNYLIKKLAYDKWKLAHIEQPIIEDYYKSKIKLDEEMLFGTGKTDDGFFGNEENEPHEEVFIEYKRLQEKRWDILSHEENGVLAEELQKEVDKIDKRIDELLDLYVYDPNFDSRIEKQDYNDYDNVLSYKTEKERIYKISMTGASVRALRNYIEQSKKINDRYFEYDSEFGFEEELERNLSIIARKEQRDPNGNMRASYVDLAEDEEYIKAREWVSKNARFIVNDELRGELNWAFKQLSTGGNRAIFKQIIKDSEAVDDKHVIDGRKISDEDIAKIKKEQEEEYHIVNEPAKSDRGLLSFVPHNKVIYMQSFYDGMTKSTTKNSEWREKVYEINEILSKYYDEGTGTIKWDEIPNTEEGREVYKKLGKLYSELNDLRGYTSKEDAKRIKEFIEKNVETELTEEEQKEFDAQEALARTKGQMYYEAWCQANYEIDYEGNRKPNHYLYHSLVPKKEVEKDFINKDKTDAIQIINRVYETENTEYYWYKFNEMKKTDKFSEWFDNNHIWNPYTHKLEPIRCWTTLAYKDTSTNAGEYVPKASQSVKNIKSKYANEKYKENVGNALNYKEHTGYDNPKMSEISSIEEEAKNYIQELLYSFANSNRDRHYVEMSYVPSMYKSEEMSAKFLMNEALKTFGWNMTETGDNKFYDQIDYAKDRIVDNPMLQLLDQKRLEDLKITKPVQEEGETDEVFAIRMKEYEDKVAKLKAENEEAHKNAINKDWTNVIYEFILIAGHYNAIQDNKLMLYYGKSVLDNFEVYQRSKGFFGDFKVDRNEFDENSKEYLKKKDTNVSGQYDNWVRRLLYDQWKESNGTFTKWAARLQNLTSAQYMMMNIRGGIANVTLGETQILAEAFAQDHFDTKDWLQAEVIYSTNIMSYFLDMDKETASSLASAIIKHFNIVDYDENTGRSRILDSATNKAFGFFRKAMYSPQTMGEHYMQNRVLFALLMSHRVFIEKNEDTGEDVIKFKNKAEVVRQADENALKSVLSDEQLEEFNEINEAIKADPNKLKKFAWYRKDFINDYVKNHLDNDQKKEYNKARKLLQEKALEGFANNEAHPTVLSQLDLTSEGTLGFKNDSLLNKYNKSDDKNISPAYKALADLRGRSISLNKKIHGVYDKMGQAQLEKKWYGSLVMQYHKHIYPGILKRYRKEGYFNEQRGTIEKGSYVALLDFLAIPFEQTKAELGLNDGQVKALQSVQSFAKHAVDFCVHVNLYWNILPEHEKGNIRRNLGDMLGVLSAMFMVVALKALADDDDEQSILYNLALYEADRLASESSQFSFIGPYNVFNESKKLWSSPIAAQSGIQDLYKSISLLSHMIMEGDEFDPYYRSGRFAGEHKLSVYIQRRIPIWRGIKTGFVDIVESNSYYKLGKNATNSKIVNGILEFIDNEKND